MSMSEKDLSVAVDSCVLMMVESTSSTFWHSLAEVCYAQGKAYSPIDYRLLIQACHLRFVEFTLAWETNLNDRSLKRWPSIA